MIGTRSLFALLVFTLMFIMSCAGGNTPLDPSMNNQNGDLTSISNDGFDGSRSIQDFAFGDPCENDLIAGQQYFAGTVELSYDLDNIYITYKTTGDWFISEVHAHVTDSPDKFPTNGAGNPQIGHFDCNESFYPPVTEYTCVFPNDFEDGDIVYYAAHARVLRIVDGQVVQDETAWGGCEDFDTEWEGNRWGNYCYCEIDICEYDLNLTLPDTVCATHSYPDPNSYWGITLFNVPDGFSVTNQKYLGWCSEKFVFLTPGSRCNIDIFSSLGDDIPTQYTDINWNAINYIVNHKLAGATPLDIQNAIWHFSDNNNPPPGSKADQMIQDANANGLDFVPGPGDVILAILVVSANQQCTFIEIPVECIED
ncbi:MAG TPA: hypothetical protein VGB30_05980 [bacterium]